MLKLLLLAASLLPAQEASMDCSHIATTQTHAVRGPGGVAAVLKVSSEDDHAKNSHLCMAVYELLVLPSGGEAAVIMNLISVDNDWGRRLSVHLGGFSRDGKRVFGIFSEGGRFPFTTLFEYDTTDRKVKSIDLKRSPAQLGAVKCGTSFAVAGTTETGAIVLEPNTANQCRINYRWLLDPIAGELQPLPQGKPIVSLYRAVVP